MTIRVLLADDQALVRSGFRMILDAKADLEVVGEAADGARGGGARRAARARRRPHGRAHADVDGLEATRRIVAAGSPARVIVLTTYDVDDYVYAALRAGASGFMLKDVRPAELADAVRVVAARRRAAGAVGHAPPARPLRRRAARARRRRRPPTSAS